MGKVLSTFDIGYAGAISRSIDDVVVALKNGGSDPIPFGVPVFLTADGDGVVAFDPDASPEQSFDTFVGFTVRDPAKTPDEYPITQDMSAIRNDQAGKYNSKDVVDVLVRGSIAVETSVGFLPGGKVYLDVTTGYLVPEAGEPGETFELENVRMKNPKTGNLPCSEVVLIARNIL